MSKPAKDLEFNAEKLRKLQEPMTIQVQRKSAGRNTPVTLPALSDGRASGKDYTYDEIQGGFLTQILLEQGGGGTYVVQAIDNNGASYTWEWWFDTMQIPERPSPSVVAAVAAQSAPPPPGYPSATAAAPYPQQFGAAQPQPRAQAPIYPLYPGQPQMGYAPPSPPPVPQPPHIQYFHGRPYEFQNGQWLPYNPMPMGMPGMGAPMPFGGFGGYPPNPYMGMPMPGQVWPPMGAPSVADKNLDVELQKRDLEHTRRLEEEQRRHRDELAKRDDEKRRTEERLDRLERERSQPQVPAGETEMVRLMREQISRLEASLATRTSEDRAAQQMAQLREAMQAQITGLKDLMAQQSGGRVDPTMALLIANAEKAQAAFTTLMTNKKEVTPQEILAMIQQANATTGKDPLAQMDGLLGLLTKLQNAAGAGQPQGNPIAEGLTTLAGSIMTTLGTYVEGAKAEKEAKANASILAAQADLVRAQGVPVQAQQQPAPALTSVPAQAPQQAAPTPAPAPQTNLGDAAGGAMNRSEMDEFEVKMFGPARQAMLNLRRGVEEGKCDSTTAVENIWRGMKYFEPMKAQVKAFELFEQQLWPKLFELFFPTTLGDFKHAVIDGLRRKHAVENGLGLPDTPPPPNVFAASAPTSAPTSNVVPFQPAPQAPQTTAPAAPAPLVGGPAEAVDEDDDDDDDQPQGAAPPPGNQPQLPPPPGAA